MSAVLETDDFVTEELRFRQQNPRATSKEFNAEMINKVLAHPEIAYGVAVGVIQEAVERDVQDLIAMLDMAGVDTFIRQQDVDAERHETVISDYTFKANGPADQSIPDQAPKSTGAWNWVKQNPGKSIAIAGVAVVVVGSLVHIGWKRYNRGKPAALCKIP